MAKPIYVPQARAVINFSDDATDDQIQAYIQQTYIKPQQQAVAPPPPPAMDRGLYNAFSSGIDDLQATGYTVAGKAAQGIESLSGSDDEWSRYFFDNARANAAEGAKYQAGEVWGADSIGEGAYSAIENIVKSAPATGVGLAATAAGTFAGGPLGGAAAGTAVFGPLNYGQNVQRQAEEQNLRLEDTSSTAPLLAAAPQTLLDQFGAGLVLKGVLPAVVKQSVVSHAVARAANTGAGRILQASAGEGLTEGAQQAIEILQANPEKFYEFGPDVQKEILDAATIGFGMGGGAAAVLEPAGKYFENKEKAKFSQLNADLAAEASQGRLEAERAEIAMGLESIAKAAPEGELQVTGKSVKRDPNDPMSDTFDVVSLTHKGKDIANFTTVSAAEKAVKEYKARTNANITLATNEVDAFFDKAPKLTPEAGQEAFKQAAPAKQIETPEAGITPEPITTEPIAATAPETAAEAPSIATPPKAVERPKLMPIPYRATSLDPDPKSGRKITKQGQSEVVDFAGRKMVVVDVNGHKVPFYLSSGLAGKAKVPAGKWYPFFGIGQNGGWINKSSSEQMARYYDNPQLKAIGESLDASIGDIRSSRAEPRVGSQGLHADFINEGLTPAEVGDADARTKVKGNIDTITQRLSAPQKMAPTPTTGDTFETYAEAQAHIEQLQAEQRQREKLMQDPRRVSRLAAQRKVPVGQLEAEVEGAYADTANRIAEIEGVMPPKPVDDNVRLGAIKKGVVENLRSIVPNERFAVNFERVIKGEGIPDAVRDQRTPRGLATVEKVNDEVDGTRFVITLATDVFDPKLSVDENVKKVIDVFNHEIVHSLYNAGLFTRSEQRVLARAARATKRPGKRYTYFERAMETYGDIYSMRYPDPKDFNAAIEEEAIAEMFREWMQNPKSIGTNTRGFMNRILQFFRRLFGGMKTADAQAVFQKVRSGEVGKRQIDENMVREPDGLYDIAPGSPMSTNLNDRGGKDNRAFGMYPYLRYGAPRYYDHKRKILTSSSTNPGNARAQLDALDELLRNHPNTLASMQAFADYLADAMGKAASPLTGVPIIPAQAVKFANNYRLIADQLRDMTPGQLRMAEDGLNGAKKFEQAYRSGTATPVHTAKLILWGILSRGVSPFVQESMFLDVVRPTGISNRTGQQAGGIDQFIIDAIEGTFDPEAYKDYVATLKIDGLPGAGTTHNLGAFGETTLVKLQQRIPDGRTILQYLHDMISDYSLSGKEIRRRFHEVNTGIGINNKVLSFMMLVSGRDDVLVLDRVQMRNQFNDGRFDDYNMYDGEKIKKLVRQKDGTLKDKGVVDEGTNIAPIGDGVFGLMYYEALERDLAKAVKDAYTSLGRGNEFSMGRYHWESWVASSAQEVDHGSIVGLTKEALGENDPYDAVYTGEGKYDTYNSGIKYGYTRNGEAFVALPDGLGHHYAFTPEFAKKVIEGYEKKANRIISGSNFKVSESTEGPWYDRPEVNKQALRAYLLAKTKEFAEQRGRPVPTRVQSAGKANPNGSGPGPVHAIRRRGGVRQVTAYDAKGIADKYISGKFDIAPNVKSEEFRTWFGNSKAVNKDGSPQRWLHGTSFDFDEFGKPRSGSLDGEDGPFFFSQDPRFTDDYSIRNNYAGGDRGEAKQGSRTIPVYLSVQNPFDYANPKHVSAVVERVRELHNSGMFPIVDMSSRNASETLENRLETLGYDLEDGDWPTIEQKNVQRAIRDLGYDAFFLKEQGVKNIAVYKRTQAKSVFNEFKRGAALSTRFSLAPDRPEVPSTPYVEQQNAALFAQTDVSEPINKRLLKFFFGNYQKGDLADAIRVQLIDVDQRILTRESEQNVRNIGPGATGEYRRFKARYSAYVALQMAERSAHVASAVLRRGAPILNMENGDINSGYFDVQNDPDNIMNVIKILADGPVNAEGKKQSMMNLFRDYAIAIRGRRLEADGKEVPNDKRWERETINLVRTQYPQVIEAHQMYQRFNRKLLEAARDAGVIKPEQFSAYTDTMDYYGFYRTIGQDVIAQPSGRKVAGDIRIMPYKGSQMGELANDPVMVMVHNTNFWIGAMMRNLAAQKSLNLLKSMGEARELQTGEEPNAMTGEEDEVLFAREKGVTKRYAVKDYLLLKSLGADDQLNMPRMLELAGIPTKFLREAVTRDPRFVVANMIRDTLASWIVRGESVVPFVSAIKGMKKAMTGSPEEERLESFGITGSYDEATRSAQDIGDAVKRDALGEKILNIRDLKSGGRALWHVLGKWSDASDAASRIPIYEAVLKETGDEFEAAFRALEVINFSRHGASTTLRVLTKLIPFLNARIQGFDVLYQGVAAGVRTATGNARGEMDALMGRRVLIRGAMLAAVSMVLEMLLSNDEDYQELPSYIKDSNLLVPIGGTKYIAMPKPFEAGFLFSTIPQHIVHHLMGKGDLREDAKLFIEQFGSTFGVNPTPQIIAPLVENIFNVDMYTGMPIVSAGQQRLDPSLRYNANTSKVARMLGEVPVWYNTTTGRFEGVSPAYIENLITGYGGPMGTYFLTATDAMLGGMGFGPDQLPYRSVADIPMIRQFLVDANSKTPKNVTDAYDLFGIVDEKNRTLSRLKASGDIEAARQYIEDNRDILMRKRVVMKMVDNLNKVRAMQRALERNDRLTREEKLAELDRLRQLEKRITAIVPELNAAIR